MNIDNRHLRTLGTTTKLAHLCAQAYALLRFRVDGRTYLQQWSFSGGFDTGRVELYALHDDATAEKVAETERGDFRLFARVKTTR